MTPIEEVSLAIIEHTIELDRLYRILDELSPYDAAEIVGAIIDRDRRI